MGEKAEQLGHFSQVKRRLRENLLYEYLEGTKKKEPGSLQWCPVTGLEAVATN